MSANLSEDKALLRANELLLASQNYAIFAINNDGAIDVVSDFTEMNATEFGQFSKMVNNYLTDVLIEAIE